MLSVLPTVDNFEWLLSVLPTLALRGSTFFCCLRLGFRNIALFLRFSTLIYHRAFEPLSESVNNLSGIRNPVKQSCESRRKTPIEHSNY